MLLNEIFNSTVELTWKQISANRTIANFDVDEKSYRCFIEAGTYNFNNKMLTFLNVGFSRIKEGKEIFDLTLDNSNAPKVLGAVINGVSKKIKEYDAVALMLGATDNVNKRMVIYKWIAHKFTMRFGTLIESIKVPNGEISLLIDTKLGNEMINSFIDHVKKIELSK